MTSSIFSFPNPVNDVAARAVAAGVVVMALGVATGRAMWLAIPLAYGFVARVAAGPRFSPLGRIATTVVAPRLDRYRKLVAGPPKRFAQAIGAVVSTSVLVLWITDAPTAARVIATLLCVPAVLEASAGYCIGCKIFAVLMRHGIVPENICAECADISRPRPAR